MRGQRGFTLIELLAVMAAIGVMAALLLPMLQNVVQDARVLTVEGDVQQLTQALLRFHAHTTVWPADNDRAPADGEADPDLMGGACAEGLRDRRLAERGLRERALPSRSPAERGFFERFRFPFFERFGLAPGDGEGGRTLGFGINVETSDMGLLCKGALVPAVLTRLREALAEGARDLLCARALSPEEARRLRRQVPEEDIDLLCRGVLPAPGNIEVLDSLVEGAVDLLCAGALSPLHARRLRRHLTDADVDFICRGTVPAAVLARARSQIAFDVDVGTPVPATNAHLARWRGPYIRREAKANPFGGSYILNNKLNVIDVVDAPTGVRDVVLMVTRLPREAQIRIDTDLDDGDPATGSIRSSLARIEGPSVLRERVAEGAVGLLCARVLSAAEASRLRGNIPEGEIDLLCRGALPPPRVGEVRRALAAAAVELLCAGGLPPVHATRLRRHLTDADVDLLCRRNVLYVVVAAY